MTLFAALILLCSLHTGNRNPTAKNVKAIKGEKATVDDADFPTMKQAINMARGIKETTKKKGEIIRRSTCLLIPLTVGHKATTIYVAL